MSFGEKLLNFALVVSVTSSVIVISMLSQRVIQRMRAADAEKPIRVPDWEQLTSSGHRTGGKQYKALIVEFSDFECPYCAKLALTVLPALQKKYGEDLAVLHRHWPLPNHRNAYAAARAAECAADQGAYEKYAMALFRQQDSIGKKSYAQYALEQGIADLERFRSCAAQMQPVEAIEKDIAAVQRLKTWGTPTLIVEGWQLNGLRPEQLDSAVQAEISRKHQVR